MNIVLLNPPHTAIGSRIPDDHLPPLGLLCVGGPLLDAGYSVQLLDADLSPMPSEQIIQSLRATVVDIIMIGHAGSSSANETVIQLCRAIKNKISNIKIIYGGIYPTYHWDEILTSCQEIDIIIRGEGEHTALMLVKAIENNISLQSVDGICYRSGDQIVATDSAQCIEDLDQFRVGWELIDHVKYSYWGNKRAVVAQFSRGCPYSCNYCGQHGFWTRWRHRDPTLFAQELARLYREHGVELINFADELPTGSREMWKNFLEALIQEDVPLILVGSTRAGDIVRDHDLLYLYKKAGVIRFLLGIESYNQETIALINKKACISEDMQAIQLLRQHGIISMTTYVVGLHEKKSKDFFHSFRRMIHYDPDQIQLVYLTPHRWTPFYKTIEQQKIVQQDTRMWDYKHQVLEISELSVTRVFIWFKFIEVMMQIRPKILHRLVYHQDGEYRHAMRWYTKIGRRVWFHEVIEYFFKTKLLKNGPTLKDYMGPSLAHRRYALKTGAHQGQRPIIQAERGQA